MMNMLTGIVLNARLKIENFFRKEDGEVNIIAIIILMAVAITLALLFKDKVKDLMDTLFGALERKASNAITN